MDGDVAADIADAEAAIRRLDEGARALADTEALARLLLRAEAVASSRIEGLEVGGRRLLRAEVATDIGDDRETSLRQRSSATSRRCGGRPKRWCGATRVEVADIREIHRRLLAGTGHQHLAGVIRDEQNWIGGSSYNPCSAAFVPPPPDRVHGLLEDLCDFIGSEDLPAVAQAALVHAQFETIHPFADGNGRTAAP